MNEPRVYADFHNVDPLGRIRLNCAGTAQDLTDHGIELQEGMILALYTDDCDDRGELDELLVTGAVAYSSEENGWVVAVDWSALRHASDVDSAQAGTHILGMPANITSAFLRQSDVSGHFFPAARCFRKNSVKISPQGSAKTPGTICARWFSRGSERSW
jgi:hypothetical protein